MPTRAEPRSSPSIFAQQDAEKGQEPLADVLGGGAALVQAAVPVNPVVPLTHTVNRKEVNRLFGV